MIEAFTKYRKLIKTEDENVARLYWDLATQAVLDYTNRKAIPNPMIGLVAELAAYYVENSARQGITSRSEGAISESYVDNSQTGGIPAYIMSRLNRYRLLHAVKSEEKVNGS